MDKEILDLYTVPLEHCRETQKQGSSLLHAAHALSETDLPSEILQNQNNEDPRKERNYVLLHKGKGEKLKRVTLTIGLEREAGFFAG